MCCPARSSGLGAGSGDCDGDLAAGVVAEHVGDGGGGAVERVGLVDDYPDGAGIQQAGQRGQVVGFTVRVAVFTVVRPRPISIARAILGRPASRPPRRSGGRAQSSPRVRSRLSLRGRDGARGHPWRCPRAVRRRRRVRVCTRLHPRRPRPASPIARSAFMNMGRLRSPHRRYFRHARSPEGVRPGHGAPDRPVLLASAGRRRVP